MSARTKAAFLSIPLLAGSVLSTQTIVRSFDGDRGPGIAVCESTAQNLATGGLVGQLPPNCQVIGFDVKGTPVGELPLPERMTALVLTEKQAISLADYLIDGIVQVALKPEPVTPQPGFVTTARVEEAKRTGWLPNVPEVTPDWILRR